MTIKNMEALTSKLIARLALRWPEAAAYIPSGSTTVHTACPLNDDSRIAFDSYTLGYQDAIEDLARIIQGNNAEPAPYALLLAEHSPFQGGTAPPANKQQIRDYRSKGKRPRTKGSEARQQLEQLFKKDKAN